MSIVAFSIICLIVTVFSILAVIFALLVHIEYDCNGLIVVSSIIFLLSLSLTIFGFCVWGNISTEMTRNDQYKISIKDNEFYYLDGENIVVKKMYSNSYKVSELGYSYIDITEEKGFWWIFKLTCTKEQIYLSESDIDLVVFES